MVRVVPLDTSNDFADSHPSSSNGGTVARKNGFSLVEMLIVVVIIGAVSLIAFPKVSSAMAKNNLRSARVTVANMFGKARAVATSTNKRTWINFTGNNVYVTATPRVVPVSGSTLDTIGTVERLDAAYGATVIPGAASLAYDPRGFASTGNATLIFVVTRGGKRDSVMVNGLGRIIK
jgi:prepilin-type N-terminal cleavage/methylation domain-containing protein